MRVLITGVAGQLGRALVKTTPSGFAVTELDREALDITSWKAVRAAGAHYNPELIINAAAYTRVDQAETEPEQAYRANAEGPNHLAELACALCARLIHVSTDYVFAGTASRPYDPSDSTEPLSVYGASKLEGEKRVLSRCPERSLIIRSGWVYNACGRNFVTTMLERMKGRQEIRVVADQIGTPT